MELYVFYFLAAVSVFAALGILLTRNVLTGAFLLVLSFLCVAGIYVIANASFIGVTQLLIYVGGILILMIFGIMLTNRLNGKAILTSNHNQFLGLLLGGVFFTMLSYILLNANLTVLENSGAMPKETIEYIGIHIMSEYMIPFEVAGILLLIALIGAAVTSQKLKQPKP